MGRAISSAAEHSLHTGGVTGSIPVSPTIFPPKVKGLVAERSPFPGERNTKIPRGYRPHRGNSRGNCLCIVHDANAASHLVTDQISRNGGRLGVRAGRRRGLAECPLGEAPFANPNAPSADPVAMAIREEDWRTRSPGWRILAQRRRLACRSKASWHTAIKCHEKEHWARFDGHSKVHDLGVELSPCLSRCSSIMSASAVISASSNAPCRSSLSLVSSASRSHIEVRDFPAPGKSCANNACAQM